MSVERVDGTDIVYHLIAFDANGRERTDDPDGIMSDLIADQLAGGDVTDVFIFSHGWRGDIPAANRQYRNWVKAMAGQTTDRRRIREHRPKFKALLVGFHWPSEPFGEEDFEDAAAFALPFDAEVLPPDVDAMVDKWSARLGGGEQVRDALRTIIAAAAEDAVPPSLPDEVREAYLQLDKAIGLGAAGVGGAPGEDREPFDPDAAYEAGFDAGVDFGSRPALGNILTPLKQLSFWTMKARGRSIGEGGGHVFLTRLLRVPGAEHVRFHLMGHSFGCITVTAMISGPANGHGPSRPMSSVVLVQGAVSLWAYCNDIPVAKGTPGYFSRFASRPDVAGPVLATTTSHDRALNFWYPTAAGISRHVDFDPQRLPRHGALGIFGIRGPGAHVTEVDVESSAHDYGFRPDKIYNVKADRIMRTGDAFSGAHSDIVHPEIAHLVWEAVRAAP
jgi:hypothetical protein